MEFLDDEGDLSAIDTTGVGDPIFAFAVDHLLMRSSNPYQVNVKVFRGNARAQIGAKIMKQARQKKKTVGKIGKNQTDVYTGGDGYGNHAYYVSVIKGVTLLISQQGVANLNKKSSGDVAYMAGVQHALDTIIVK